MKTAISLPEDVFESADRLARRTGRSRSQLYADALREYVARHDEDEVTTRLNALCAELDTSLPPEIARASKKILERSEW